MIDNMKGSCWNLGHLEVYTSLFANLNVFIGCGHELLRGHVETIWQVTETWKLIFSVYTSVTDYFNVEIFWFNFRTLWQQIYTVHQWSQKIPKGALVCIEELTDEGRSRAVWVAWRNLPPKEHPQHWHATSSLVTPGRRVARKPGESNSSSNTFGIYLCMSGALPLLHLFTSSTSPDNLQGGEKNQAHLAQALAIFSPESELACRKNVFHSDPPIYKVYMGGHSASTKGLGGNVVELCWARQCWNNKISMASCIRVGLDQQLSRATHF